MRTSAEKNWKFVKEFRNSEIYKKGPFDSANHSMTFSIRLADHQNLSVVPNEMRPLAAILKLKFQFLFVKWHLACCQSRNEKAGRAHTYHICLESSCDCDQWVITSCANCHKSELEIFLDDSTFSWRHLSRAQLGRHQCPTKKCQFNINPVTFCYRVRLSFIICHANGIFHFIMSQSLFT